MQLTSHIIPPPGYVGWRFLTLNVLPPPDPTPRRRCSHPRREGHRGAEAFPRSFGGLLQATAGEGGETVWGKVPGKSFLPACDLSAAWKVLFSSVRSFSTGTNGICSHYVFWWIQKSVCSSVLVVLTFIPTYIFLLFFACHRRNYFLVSVSISAFLFADMKTFILQDKQCRKNGLALRNGVMT